MPRDHARAASAITGSVIASSPLKTLKPWRVVQYLGNLRDVAARLLYADHIRKFGQPQHRRRLHVGARARRNVVQQNRQLHRLCNGAEVLELALLAGPVVVRIGRQNAVQPGIFAIFRARATASLCVVSAAAEDRHASRRGLHCDLNDAAFSASVIVELRPWCRMRPES